MKTRRGSSIGLDPGSASRNLTRIIPHEAAIVRQSGLGRLVVIRGPDRGDAITVSPEPLVIGSGAGSDARLSDATISRRHLQVALTEGGLVVRDLGSTNGSFVRGARFQELILGYGAEIQIGQTVLKYLPEEEAVEIPPAEAESFGALVGRDPKMRQVFRLLTDVAATDATVLLEGQTGTGKELLAEEIHRHSPRRDQPLRGVRLRGGAQGADRVGAVRTRARRLHRRGGRSARRLRRGRGRAPCSSTRSASWRWRCSRPACGPSIGRMVRPVGGAGYQNVSVRVVAATNRDLRAEVAARRFREDLYYRVAVFRISVPPLRERPPTSPSWSRASSPSSAAAAPCTCCPMTCSAWSATAGRATCASCAT
jgi:pSer/pThr/pTyr-binding forkhead associated (FHA) protein